jgi:hypothetical protein
MTRPKLEVRRDGMAVPEPTEAFIRETFQRCGSEGKPAAKVAAELGMTENSVILAKARVLKRLRQEAGELLL